MPDKVTKAKSDVSEVKKEKAAEGKDVKVAEAVKVEKAQQKTEVKQESPINSSTATAKKKFSKKRYIARAKAHILCSYNNTVITISDLNGNVLGWASSGALGFKGPKKSTPFAATLVAQKLIEKTARYGIKEVEIFIRGVGGGREASVRALGNAGLMITSIKDVTPMPHNGCRPKKPRRV